LSCNFTNTLQAAFAPIFFKQKITQQICKQRKAAKKTFEQIEQLVKCNLHQGLISPTFYKKLLLEAFTQKDPQSAKKIDSLTVYFALLESARIKDGHKMLVKSTPGRLATKRCFNVMQDRNQRVTRGQSYKTVRHLFRCLTLLT